MIKTGVMRTPRLIGPISRTNTCQSLFICPTRDRSTKDPCSINLQRTKSIPFTTHCSYRCFSCYRITRRDSPICYDGLSKKTKLSVLDLVKNNQTITRFIERQNFSTTTELPKPKKDDQTDQNRDQQKQQGEDDQFLIEESFLSKNKNIISLVLFITTGLGLFFYFKEQKINQQRLLEKRQRQSNKSFGKVRIGGEFSLINAKDGKPFTEKDLIGKFSLIYFGFTNCPDICPEELDKMCDVINRIKEDQKYEKDPIPIQPIFVSVDPNRDSRNAITTYLADFECNDELIGLTGSYESIKQMCKSYRVYFSTPPNLKPGDDYLVDHSIFFYLMAPNGNFVDAFGKIFNQDQVYDKVKIYVNKWKNGKRFGEETVEEVEDDD
ncbi:SCO1/SenC-domain-containing protein [Phakopsora pachyrhizi]|uniref:SCO1/SenC-domain-containing protein n=1 Tax=Phakopsora pachyrhizi TaxID=170000 RepID=A0AAV0BMJ4_PHAPC|nr:SCO1/SenC-domain-containing protein [Phakopsora pachyrhizi]